MFIKQKKDQKEQIPKINPYKPQEVCVAAARIAMFNYSYSFLPCVIRNQKQIEISPGLPEAREQDKIPVLQREVEIFGIHHCRENSSFRALNPARAVPS